MNPCKYLWNILIIQSRVHHHQCHDEYNDLHTNNRNTCILEQIHRENGTAQFLIREESLNLFEILLLHLDCFISCPLSHFFLQH